jgi:hypothetical protein
MKYLDGTTDITRTVHFGNPSTHEKASYTAVCGFRLPFEHFNYMEQEITVVDIITKHSLSLFPLLFIQLL